MNVARKRHYSMMRAIILALAVGMPLVATTASAQNGRVYDDLVMTSEILHGERKYAIYLPWDYEISERSYPVLYLLHGRGDDQTAWIQFGDVHRIADEAIRNGIATPMIIVMPDATSGIENYFNRPDNDWRYEDFFFEEFIPFIEQTYRARSTRQYRAVAGLSMGGGGTFLYALHRPDMFYSAAPLSASFTLDMEAFRKYFDISDALSNESLEAYWRRHSVLYLIENMPEDQKRAVRWYIDCGDDDFLYEPNAMAHIAMRKRGIPHEYRVRDGGHRWQYWREALPEVLRFVSEAFRR
jgi:enterochelin esterase-like enzyme